jgi:dihydrolipoamide dehydrogenase
VKVGKASVKFSIEIAGKKQDIVVEKVLVAAGRAPNVEDIGIKELGVAMTDRGFI